MHRHFVEELEELKNRLLHMGNLVDMAIQLGLQGLNQRSKDAATQVIAEIEPEINSLHLELDDRALKLLALQQPMATDLRLIASTMKINSDLERMGDQAVNIAQRVLSILTQPSLPTPVDIQQMAEAAQKMTKDALYAFTRSDTQLAREILLRDDEVDHARDQSFGELVALMIKDPRNIQPAMDLVLISRHLERIADHATNIAEDVIYLVSGRDIRHHAEEKGLTENK